MITPSSAKALPGRIEMEGDMIVSGMAETADQAIGLIQKSEPDIVVTDLSLSGRPGLELIKEIRAFLARVAGAGAFHP